MGSKSKNKGKTFERELCKLLGDMYNDNFERVPYSGAFTGGKNVSRKQSLTENQIKTFKGDIIPPDNWQHFNCEAKNYADFPFHRLLFNAPVPTLEQWLEQLMDASDEGDINMLFFKITRIGKFVAYEDHGIFNCDRVIKYKDTKKRVWCITEFDNFFDNNKKMYEEVHTNNFS